MDIDGLSGEVAAMARKNLSAILRGLASVSQVRVAEQLGASETTVSRMKDDFLERAAAFIAACGLKVVPREFRCVDPKKFEAFETLFTMAMAQTSVTKLVFEDSQQDA